MRISTVLVHIDSRHMALPEFQRGYVWNGEQVRKLFDSLYKRHPVGGLLVWATDAKTAAHRGDGALGAGVVKLLLDGQQRMTSLYGVVRGKPPEFFDGNAKAFTGLQFHLESMAFEFYQPIKMKDDPLWVDVTKLMKSGNSGVEEFLTALNAHPHLAPKIGNYASRLNRLLGILDIELHIDEVTGDDKSLDVVVEIFNNVNSGGTKLSKGDLALAKICAEWPEGREVMKAKLKEWATHGYNFNLDWLLRSVNTVLTGEAKFSHLYDRSADEIQASLKRANKHLDTCLNLIGGRLGLDHDQVLFGRFSLPVMVRYFDQKKEQLGEVERDKLLFWYVQASMWGRYSSSTESKIDADLAAIEGETGSLDKLLELLRLAHGGLRVDPGHFTGWSLGARFYPVLYWLTRMGSAKDWGSGLPLKASLLGKMSKLEVHHIYPKAKLYKRNFKRPEVNALANFCFLTKDTNLNILDSLPENYFPKIEEKHPGALATQWVPTDEKLWKIENYRDFLEARKNLLAAEANRQLAELLHGDTRWMSKSATVVPEPLTVVGGITSEAEEDALEALNSWVLDQGLPVGQVAYDHADPQTGEQVAVFDLAWPNGIQEELSVPVAVLLDESSDVIALASAAGYRCFTTVNMFKDYIQRDILGVSSSQQ